MRRFWPEVTFWRGVAAVTLAVGLYATVVRFGRGLGAATHLSDGFPWGIWVGFDVLVGVGLAAGGFTITATVHLFNLERFRPIVRPTVLTAFLGYLLVAVGLLYDLGRPYRIWHPLIMWNPHSVMFEVAWCVMLYTAVLSLEFSPMVLERFKLRTPLRVVHGITIPVVIAGVLLSTLHQSSLGTLYLIVPEKLHGLWYSPLLPVFFFLSAIAAGLSMVIIESFISSRAFGRRLELGLLRDLGRVVVVALGLYLVIKLQDMSGRGAFGLLAAPTPERFLFLVEMVFGVLIPMVLLALPAVRRDRAGLFCSALLVVLGFIMNRLNVSLTGVQGGMDAVYFPSWLELAVTAMLVTLGFISFGLAVKHLKVFPEGHQEERPVSLGRRPRPVAYLSRGALAALGAVIALGALTLDFEAAARGRVPAQEVTAGSGSDLSVLGGGASVNGSVADLRLPGDLTYPPGKDSPGAVTFSHESHVDGKRPNCATCHGGAFPILKAKAAARTAGEAMHGAQRCGACHDGKAAFGVEDNCEGCHAGG